MLKLAFGDILLKDVEIASRVCRACHSMIGSSPDLHLDWFSCKMHYDPVECQTEASCSAGRKLAVML